MIKVQVRTILVDLSDDYGLIDREINMACEKIEKDKGSVADIKLITVPWSGQSETDDLTLFLAIITYNGR